LGNVGNWWRVRFGIIHSMPLALLPSARLVGQLTFGPLDMMRLAGLGRVAWVEAIYDMLIHRWIYQDSITSPPKWS
jgi:hypothetical protein